MSAPVESKEFWERQSEQYNASGLSRSRYCRENNINYDQFGYWLKKLLPTSSKFIPVKLQTSAIASPQPALCTLEMRGHTLKIHDLSALSFVLERLA